MTRHLLQHQQSKLIERGLKLGTLEPVIKVPSPPVKVASGTWTWIHRH